jgi:outer membrane protein TolC
VKPRKFLPLALLILAGPSSYASTLGLENYLDQVAKQSPGVAAARLNTEAGSLRSEAAEVLTFPYLFGGWGSLDDKTPQPLPAFQGTDTQGNSTTLGVGVNSTVGLNAKYTFNSGWSNVVGLPPYNHYTAYNRLDLTQSLVKNGFGSQIRAQSEQARAAGLALSLASEFSNQAQLVGAEAAYWRLAVARETVLVQKDALARADRLLQWAKRRVSLQLGDQSDLLQAQANYDLHKLDLESSKQEEINAGRAFNTLRKVEGEQVSETLTLPTLEQTLAMHGPGKRGTRLDVKAAEQQTKVAQAQAQIDKENVKPTLDVVASYGWNGRDASRSKAVTDSLRSDLPTKSIALNFAMPLDVPTWKNSIQGSNQQIEAANYDLEQKHLDEEKDWNDLNSHLADARNRLDMARGIEKVQKQKFENERERLLRGRTTTYQTLTFEQDYASSQLLVLRTQAEVLQVLSQLKLYRGEQ